MKMPRNRFGLSPPNSGRASSERMFLLVFAPASLEGAAVMWLSLLELFAQSLCL
jgi:hypothetical protein